MIDVNMLPRELTGYVGHVCGLWFGSYFIPLKIVVLPVPACFSCWNRRFPCFHDCLEV